MVVNKKDLKIGAVLRSDNNSEMYIKIFKEFKDHILFYFYNYGESFISCGSHGKDYISEKFTLVEKVFPVMKNGKQCEFDWEEGEWV